VFGNQQAQDEFARDHAAFIEGFPRFRDTVSATLELIDSRCLKVEDLIVLFLARMALEDFRQIVILCSNGEMTGGMKILRGMFERVTTAKYLQMHPEEVDAFINYGPEIMYKQAIAANLSEERLAEARAARDAVKTSNKVYSKRRGAQKNKHTWSKMDLVAMAKKVGLDIPLLYAYYIPMEESHATIGAVYRRMNGGKEAGGFVYDDTQDPQYHVLTLFTAHSLVWFVLQMLKDHFKLEEAVKERFGQGGEDFHQIWINSGQLDILKGS
jgi:hypothetical protein